MALDNAVPNHHRDHPGFAGVIGLLAALSMTVGRGGDARLAAALTAVGPDDTVVDVGCGPGVAARHAARAGASVIGVDPAPVMLRFARLLSPGLRRIRYVEGTAEALPLDDGAATVLWSIATVHHWADVDAGLSAARRVLRPAGRLLAIERRTQPGARGLASHGWTSQQAEAFAERCRSHGFDDVRIDEHPGGRRPALTVLAVAP
ncbi:MAG TPA: class I SAM-dependent methyltransferase [Acidimicrobiales bacterium]|nr:class I SAM-dependent methyltransferase [Acidimicrobiales bacterium]